MITKTLEELYLGRDPTFHVSMISSFSINFGQSYSSKLFIVNILWHFRVMLKIYLKDLSKVLER